MFAGSYIYFLVCYGWGSTGALAASRLSMRGDRPTQAALCPAVLVTGSNSLRWFEPRKNQRNSFPRTDCKTLLQQVIAKKEGA